MKGDFEEAVQFTFQEEGWHSDEAFDPGGDTILGISRHFWPHEHDLIKNMAPADAREYAEEFYHEHFWDFMGCDDLSHPLDVVAFDSAVNPGPTWARTTLHITQDWKEFLDMREQHYRITALPQYVKGLLNRCAALRAKYEVTA
jgi:lysozyme family protein